jgi:mono/diheme cytochrome c family protein
MTRSWRMRPTIFALVVAVVPQLHGASVAQELVGSAAAGRRLAAAWCSECHAIEHTAKPTIGLAPEFVSIARLPSTTALSLNVFLRSSHRDMPNLVIAKSDADDIIAYILSLKDK